MSNIRFTNFARAPLAVGVTTGDTILALAGGTGALFPTLTGGQYFFATLEDAQLNREIVRVTGRTVDSLVVVRGQDNTTARSWTAGASVSLRLNAGALHDHLTATATSATNAAASATTAGNAATSATASQTAAANSAAAALASQAAAATSATNAATSATNAAASATTAGNAATSATASQTAAANSATAAAGSATSAATSAANAAASAASADALILRQNLASPSGASLVGYQPAGAGAVATNVQSKLRQLPASGADYGSLPNSGVDEWVRLNNAMQANYEVQLEEGVYLVSRGLRQTLNGAVLRGRGKKKTIIRAISPTGDGKFGGTNGNEAVVWAVAPEGSPLHGLKCEDLTIDCAGLMTGLPSGDVRLKGHHYRRVHGFEVNRVEVVECGSYAFWANDKLIESGGVQTGCIGVYNDCEAVDSGISFETTGRAFITYNRPRATQTRSTWNWPIFEVYHFYSGDGLITVNGGYGKCDASTIIGPTLTQKNVIFNGGYFEQLNAGTTVINMFPVNSSYDNWVFNNVVMLSAGVVGVLNFGALAEATAKMTFNGGRYVGAAGVGLIFTSVIPGHGVVEMHGVDCKSTQTGAAVPFSLIVTGDFKSFQVFGGNQEAFGPAVVASPVNAPSAKFSNVRFVPTSSVAETVRQSRRGSALFANAGGVAQINLGLPMNVANKAKVVVAGAVEASSVAAGGGEAVPYSWNNPEANIINILAPVAAVGRTFNYLITEYE